jgi:L-arabinokinase
LSSLRPTPVDEQLEALGELMFFTHQSYSDCGLGSPGTDRCE